MWLNKGWEMLYCIAMRLCGFPHSSLAFTFSKQGIIWGCCYPSILLRQVQVQVKSNLRSLSAFQFTFQVPWEKTKPKYEEAYPKTLRVSLSHVPSQLGQVKSQSQPQVNWDISKLSLKTSRVTYFKSQVCSEFLEGKSTSSLKFLRVQLKSKAKKDQFNSKVSPNSVSSQVSSPWGRSIS